VPGRLDLRQEKSKRQHQTKNQTTIRLPALGTGATEPFH